MGEWVRGEVSWGMAVAVGKVGGEKRREEKRVMGATWWGREESMGR